MHIQLSFLRIVLGMKSMSHDTYINVVGFLISTYEEDKNFPIMCTSDAPSTLNAVVVFHVRMYVCMHACTYVHMMCYATVCTLYVCTVSSIYCTRVSVLAYIMILAMMVLYRQEITQLEDKIHGARERYKESITTSGEDSISAIPKVRPFYTCQYNDRVLVAILRHNTIIRTYM